MEPNKPDKDQCAPEQESSCCTIIPEAAAYPLTPPEPSLRKLFTCEVALENVYSLGETDLGHREVVTVCGGSFSGIAKGKILPFGGDIGLLHDGNVNEIHTTFILSLNEEQNVLVECIGKLLMEDEKMLQLNGDEEYYFRQGIKLFTGAEGYSWLNNIVAIGSSLITPEGNVITDIYQVE